MFLIVQINGTGERSVVDRSFDSSSDAREAAAKFVQGLHQPFGYQAVGDFWQVDWPSGENARIYIEEEKFIEH